MAALSLHSKDKNSNKKNDDGFSLVSLFGKVPARADFVRINHGYPASLELDTWLQQSLEELVIAGKRFTGSPMRFFFAPKQIPQVLIGMLAPSQDKAGRAFPIAIFGTLPVDIAATNLAFVPFAFSAFMAEAQALITDLPNLDYEQLRQKITEFRFPHTNAFEQADTIRKQWLETTKVVEIVKRIFGGEDQTFHHYALQTFVQALEERQNQPSKKAIVLDCPAELDVDVFLWLEITRRKFGVSSQLPSFFWLSPPSSQLLFSLGFPPPRLFRDHMVPEHQNSCLRPLKSDDPEVLARAQEQMGPRLDRFTDSSTLQDLISALL